MPAGKEIVAVVNDRKNRTRIFVFASNLAGIHGAGSAKEAFLNHGAIRGQGVGRQGNSYAIPTKDGRDGKNLRFAYQVLRLETIEGYVKAFLLYAKCHPELEFDVVAIGCGLSGYKPEQIAPMFQERTPNVHLPEEFKTCQALQK